MSLKAKPLNVDHRIRIATTRAIKPIEQIVVYEKTKYDTAADWLYWLVTLLYFGDMLLLAYVAGCSLVLVIVSIATAEAVFGILAAVVLLLALMVSCTGFALAVVIQAGIFVLMEFIKPAPKREKHTYAADPRLIFFKALGQTIKVYDKALKAQYSVAQAVNHDLLSAGDFYECMNDFETCRLQLQRFVNMGSESLAEDDLVLRPVAENIEPDDQFSNFTAQLGTLSTALEKWEKYFRRQLIQNP